MMPAPRALLEKLNLEQAFLRLFDIIETVEREFVSGLVRQIAHSRTCATWPKKVVGGVGKVLPVPERVDLQGQCVARACPVARASPRAPWRNAQCPSGTRNRRMKEFLASVTGAATASS